MGYNTHQFVSNTEVGRHYATATRQNCTAGLLSDQGALLLRILEGLKSGDRPDFYRVHKTALDELYLAGWIDADIRPSGPIRQVPTRYHLKTLQIETLLRCNLSCEYCYCEAGKERSEILSPDDIVRLLDDAARLGVLAIDFTGGEFFLYPDWKNILLHARALGLPVALHTNGMALTERNVDILDEVGVTRVQVSADGGTAEEHNAVRGHPRAFQAMVDGINRLVARHIPVQVNVMAHRINAGRLPDIKETFESMGAQVTIDWIAPFGSERDARYGSTPAEYFEAVAAIPGMRTVVDEETPCGRDLGWTVEAHEPPCGVAYSFVFVTATGELAICPTLTSREDAVLFNGPNLRDQSLYDAWDEGSYFDRHRFVNCANVGTCPAGTTCNGGCRANAFAMSKGRLDAPDFIMCNLNKNSGTRFVDFEARYRDGHFGPVAASMDTDGC